MSGNRVGVGCRRVAHSNPLTPSVTCAILTNHLTSPVMCLRLQSEVTNQEGCETKGSGCLTLRAPLGFQIPCEARATRCARAFSGCAEFAACALRSRYVVQHGSCEEPFVLGGDQWRRGNQPVADLTFELPSARPDQRELHRDGFGRRCPLSGSAATACDGVTRQRAVRAEAAAGVGPRVHNSEKDAMIVVFCPGETLTEAEFRAACSAAPAAADAALLVRVSTTLRKLHAIEVPEEMTAVASAGWAPADVRKWIALAEQGGYTRLPMIARARELLEELEAAAGPPSTPPAFCHYDLLPDNLVVGRGGDEGVWVIDFEYAAAGQPLMDLTGAVGAISAPRRKPPRCLPHRLCARAARAAGRAGALLHA